MALTLDEKGIGESVGKLAEGKSAEAAALLANVLVAAFLLPLVGPAALGAGKAAEGTVRALANRISDSAIRKMLRAGEELDAQRAGVAAVVEAMAEVLSGLEQRQVALIDDSRIETQEQFLQLITFMRHNVVAPLEELRKSLAATPTATADWAHDQLPTPAAILDLFSEATDDLLNWPQTLRDGRWLARPEMDQILDAVRHDQQRPVVLLGSPGSGKSALLARLGGTLRAEGWQVVAIKADRLPAEVGTLRGLREHLNINMPIDGALEALGREGKTLLLVDQLDALADLVDLRTERLSVLLALINRVMGLENVRVFCSAREFDFRHDVRFQRLDSIEIHLALPSDTEIDAVLVAAGIKSADLPAKLRALLRTPQWLKLFLHLTFSTHEELPTTWR